MRVVSIIASFLFCTYFLLHEPKLVTATIWNLVFVAVNVVQLAIEWRGRAKIPLGVEGSFIQERVFNGLTARDIQALLNVSKRREIEVGSALVSENNPAEDLTVIVSGEAKSRAQSVMAPGTLIGVRGLLTQQAEVVDATATKKTICLTWPHADVRQWAKEKSERHSELMQKISMTLAQQLASKSA